MHVGDVPAEGLSHAKLDQYDLPGKRRESAGRIGGQAIPQQGRDGAFTVWCTDRTFSPIPAMPETVPLY